MRIGMFTESYTPYISGVVLSVQGLRRALERLGHEVFVFAPSYPGGKESEEGVFRFPSIPVPHYPQYRVPLPQGSRIRRRVSELRLDLIHAHSPFIMGRIGMRIARQMGIPFCFTYHTMYDVYLEHYLSRLGRMLRPALIAYLKAFCNRCDLIIAPSVKVERQLREWGVKVPIQPIPTGIDVAKFAQAVGDEVRKNMGVSGDEPVLLYLGRLGPEKNLHLLLDAFERVAAQRRDVRFLFVGDGPSRRELERLVHKGKLSGRVHFTGSVRPEEVPDYYAAGDVYVFPSVTETQGVAVAEALAAGLPVVSVHSEVLAEYVRSGQEGMLVRPDGKSLAEACLRVLDNPGLREALSRAARRRAEDYRLEHMAARVLDQYRLVLGQTRRRVS